MQVKRCAVYTRVSTDMQAEKEFNSCEAQAERIKSFIKSQDGFEVYKTYSDPGYTGANLKRPALQELLQDVKDRNIDLVLVYKIDRLTRSPRDFYYLVEVFEKHKADFISVTERFDTSTPSGRLLRNIMLTFAQFERELSSERVRDKMFQRASKGMWNGGISPYGYMRENKKLVINKKEAEIVKYMYETYIETGSLFQVYRNLKTKGINNRNGKIIQNKAISDILRNVAYTGKIKYADKIYQGEHKPIISEELFNLAQNIHKKRIKKFRLYKNYLLGGLIRCKECGYAMTPTYTNKHTKKGLWRYFYYCCVSVLKTDWESCTTKEVNSDKLESFIIENLQRIEQDKTYLENLVFKLNHTQKPPYRAGFEQGESQFTWNEESIKESLRNIIKIAREEKKTEQNLKIREYIKEVIYSPEQIEIKIKYNSIPAENNSEFADDKLINPLRSEKEFSYSGSSRTADRRIVAGTGARAWAGRNEFSDSEDNLGVRKLAKSGGGEI